MPTRKCVQGCAELKGVVAVAIITITNNAIVLASVEAKKGGSIEISNPMLGRRIANRLTKTDEAFATTTDDTNYSLAEAVHDLENFTVVYCRLMDGETITQIADDMSIYSLRGVFDEMRYDMQRRGVKINRANRNHYWEVRMKVGFGNPLVAAFHNGIYYQVTPEMWKKMNESETWDMATPTVCPYTGETRAEKLHYMRYMERFAYSNVYVAEKWVKSREGLCLCPDCGRVERRSNLRQGFDYETNEYRYVCADCFHAAMWCDEHLRYELNAVVARVGRTLMCTQAYNELQENGSITQCPHCREIVLTSQIRTVMDEDDEEITACANCASLIHGGIDWKNQRGTLSYSTKPNPRFYDVDGKHKFAEKDLYIGFELELDQEHRNWRNQTSDDSDKFAANVMKEWNGELYVKSDGSLRSGAETVSMPHTIEAIYKFDWDKYMEFVGKYDICANSTCGLHTHISKTAFGYDSIECAENIAKLIVLVNRNYQWFVKVARRDYSAVSHWAARYDENCIPYSESNFDAQRIVRWCRSEGRYHAVNLANSTTVEIRMWASSTDVDTITGTCDFAQALVRMACAMSVHDAYTWEGKDIAEHVVNYAYDVANVNRLLALTVGNN